MGGDVATATKTEQNASTGSQKVAIPGYIGRSLTSFLIFIMGATMRADWLLFLSYYWKSMEKQATGDLGVNADIYQGQGTLVNNGTDLAWNDQVKSFFEVRFANLLDYCIPAFLVSYFFFFAIGGYLHYAYYVLRRDHPEEWKCQPNHWLSPELELHEIVVGAFSLTIGSFISSAMACWVMNDGYSTIYFDPAQEGYWWLFLQLPVIFIWQDYLTYWGHRIFHLPFLYVNFHKLHHTYKQPTAFSVTAIHPVEFVIFQSIYISPMFLFKIHWVPFSFVLLYTYYHGIIDHSGITFKRYFWQPWQPDCIFHDNHHQYFHVNFGFNIEYWDILHGTYRQKDRIYHEDIFYGKGKSIDEATSEEFEQDMKERISENPLAYTGNTLHFELSQEEIEKSKKKN